MRVYKTSTGLQFLEQAMTKLKVCPRCVRCANAVLYRGRPTAPRMMLTSALLPLASLS